MRLTAALYEVLPCRAVHKMHFFLAGQSGGSENVIDAPPFTEAA